MGMTQQREMIAEYTIKNLPTEREHPGSLALRFLVLIGWTQTELEALEAGMPGQAPAARALQNAMWNAQHAAQQDIVTVALAAGVDADAIMTITHRSATR